MAIPKQDINGQNTRLNQVPGLAGCTDLQVAGAGVNTAITASLPAVVAGQNTIHQVFWSLNGATTPGRLQIFDGASLVFDSDLSGTQNVVSFSPPLASGATNQALAAQLAGVAGATGKLNVRGVTIL